MTLPPDTAEPDAYRLPRRVQPGCSHQLACRCDVPYWLRASSPAELEYEAWLRRPRPLRAHPGAVEQ